MQYMYNVMYNVKCVELALRLPHSVQALDRQEIVMSQMVRKQIYIKQRQQSMLKRLAKARGVSEAELIREAIDQKLSGGSTGAFQHDPKTWAKALGFMQSLHAQGAMPDRPRTWKRDDAYADRLSRHDGDSG